MNCPHCSYQTMVEIGCTVSFRPAHWCPSCGTLRTCDGFTATPNITHEWDKFLRQTDKNKPGNR